MSFIIRVFFTMVWILGLSVLLLPLTPFFFFTFNMNQLYGRCFYRVGSWITGIKSFPLNPGEEAKHQPCIYVVNHQSALDILIFAPIYPPRTVLIGKKEIWYVPFFNLFYWAGRNIFINRKSRTHSIAGLDQAVEYIQKNRASIWIFPEGTRNRTDQPLLPFKKGAFHMAIQAQVPIVPIVGGSMRGFLNWDARLLKPGKVLVKTLPAISTRGMTSADMEALMKTCHDQMEKAVIELTEQIKRG